MTDEEREDRMEAIEGRLAKATPGPWHAQQARYPDLGEGWSVHTADGEILRPTLENAELVANAPADLLWLIERVRDLEVERECLIHGTP
jgi:hypothetical protein